MMTRTGAQDLCRVADPYSTHACGCACSYFLLALAGSSWKTTLWEGGHRVVGIAHWPGTVPHAVSGALASSLDFMPTFAEARAANRTSELRCCS